MVCSSPFAYIFSPVGSAYESHVLSDHESSLLCIVLSSKWYWLLWRIDALFLASALELLKYLPSSRTPASCTITVCFVSNSMSLLFVCVLSTLHSTLHSIHTVLFHRSMIILLGMYLDLSLCMHYLPGFVLFNWHRTIIISLTLSHTVHTFFQQSRSSWEPLRKRIRSSLSKMDQWT